MRESLRWEKEKQNDRRIEGKRKEIVPLVSLFSFLSASSEKQIKHQSASCSKVHFTCSQRNLLSINFLLRLISFLLDALLLSFMFLNSD